MVIPDYSWVLYALLSVVAAVAIAYSIGLLVWNRHSRAGQERRGLRQAPAGGLDRKTQAIQTP
jgi:hypothetical protein